MTRRDWWLGLFVVVLAVLLHALVPRYEWRVPNGGTAAMIRLDRWTGRAELGWVRRDWARWVSARELDAKSEASRRAQDKATRQTPAKREVPLSVRT